MNDPNILDYANTDDQPEEQPGIKNPKGDCFANVRR